jgi:hypothetical protein
MAARFRVAMIATGLFLALLWMQSAKADSFEITGSAGTAFCATQGKNCQILSYNLLITTSPLASLKSRLTGSLLKEVPSFDFSLTRPDKRIYSRARPRRSSGHTTRSK